MKLSIIYITNHPGGYDILVDSVKNQTCQDYELIVVDDMQKRQQAVQEYLKNNGIKTSYVGPSKPKCFPELGYNVLNAMNTGILISKGDIVVILTDYQWLPPDSFERWLSWEREFEKGKCIVAGGDMYDDKRVKDNNGVLSVWDDPWHGPAEENHCKFAFRWQPDYYEMAYTAFPYELLKKVNAFPECYDCTSGTGHLEAMIRRIHAVGGCALSDKGHIIQMINHRVWEPVEIWHCPKSTPKGSTELVIRENCFDLKDYVRGSILKDNLIQSPSSVKEGVKTFERKETVGVSFIKPKFTQFPPNVKEGIKTYEQPIETFCNLVYALERQNMTVAEVGVYDGSTTVSYLHYIGKNNGKLYAIDWFKGNINAGPGPHQYSPENSNNIYNQFMENIKKTGWSDCVHVLRGRSWEMAKYIPDKSLDICFIDADHRYVNVKRDILAYIPKIKDGGIMCGHDCEDIYSAGGPGQFTEEELNTDVVKGKGHCGVMQAVYDIFRDDVKTALPDKMWIARHN